jgi:hypothetical protein
MNTSGPIEGRDNCVAAWREVLCALPESGARALWCVDAEFEAWPFDEPGVLEAVQRWARTPGRVVNFIARDFEAVTRHHPRLSAWRRDWSHCIQAWTPDPEDRIELPCLLIAGRAGVELLDPERWRARRVGAAAELRQLVETTEAIAQRCGPAWPATVLGL